MTTTNGTKDTVVTGFAGANTTPVASTAGKGAGADSLAALRAQLGQKAAGYHFHKGEDMFDTYMEKGVNFVTAKNGIFRVTANKIGVFATKVGEAPKANSVPGIVDLKEGTTLRIPKIPFLHWLQVLTFYRDVHKADGTEASILFFWNHNEVQLPKHYAAAEGAVAPEVNGVLENGQLIVYCPKQRNSSGLSEFGMDTMVPWLRQNCTTLCETHSHHTMGAFWSGTDNANENMTQFYGVYGTIFQSNPAFLFRYVHGDDKKDISMWELFEKPVTRVMAQVDLGEGQVIDIDNSSDFEYKGPWPAVKYPEDWMPQHSKSAAVVASYSNYQGGYGATGRGGAYNAGHANQGGYGSGGANTQHRGAYQGTGSYDHEDDEGYAYLGPGRGYSRHQASSQVVELEPRGKKNAVDGTNNHNLNTREIVQRKRVVTATSDVEIISTEPLSPWAETQMQDLVENLSEAGYDHFIMNMLRRLSTAMG